MPANALTFDQIEDGLNILQWTNFDASKASGISLSTIKRFRSGKEITQANRRALVDAILSCAEFRKGGWVRRKTNKT